MDLICFKLVAMIPRDQNLVQTMKKNFPKRFFAIDRGRSKKKKIQKNAIKEVRERLKKEEEPIEEQRFQEYKRLQQLYTQKVKCQK